MIKRLCALGLVGLVTVVGLLGSPSDAYANSCAVARRGVAALQNFVRLVPQGWSSEVPVHAGAQKWNACGSGSSDLPEVWVGTVPPGSFTTLTISLVEGSSTANPTACGEIVAGMIKIYSHYKESGVTKTCAARISPADAVAHEIGHYFGLADVSGGSCDTTIMADPGVGLNRPLTAEQCAKAKELNTTTNERNSGCDPLYAECRISPIVLRSSRVPWHMTSSEGGVRFDHAGDGYKEQTAWTQPSDAIAFLGLDRNANGTIDDGTELFGDNTRLEGVGTYVNGFEALVEHDLNRDAVLSAQDPIWSRLLLWFDRNHDGISERTELEAVEHSGLQSISVIAKPSPLVDGYGNEFRLRGRVEWRDAETGVPKRDHAYDVYLLIGE